MKVKAALIFEQGLDKPYKQSEAVKVDEIDLEGPGDTEILVEVAAAGLLRLLVDHRDGCGRLGVCSLVASVRA